MNPKRAEWESALTPLVKRFEEFYLGRKPAVTRVQLDGDILLVRSRGALTEAETRLTQADPTPAGRESVEQLFRRMFRQNQAGLVGAIESVLGVGVRAVHGDLEVATGESLLAFSLERDPAS